MGSNKKDIVADDILIKFNAWDSARDEKQKRWMRASRIVNLRNDPIDQTEDKPKERSRLQMPATKSANTMAKDNLYQMLFDADQFFDIQGRTPDDNPEVVKAYLKYLWDKDNNQKEMKSFISDLTCYGTGICQVAIDVVTEKRLIQKSKSGQTLAKRLNNRFFKLPENRAPNSEVSIDKKVLIRPSFKWVDIFNFYIEPQAMDIQSSTGVIIRKQLKFHTLRQMQQDDLIEGVERIADNLKNAMPDDSNAPNIPMDDDRRERLLSSGLIADLGPGDVSLLEYWGWLDRELLVKAGYEGKIDNGGAEVVVLVANGTTVLKLKPNPLLTGERPFYSETYESISGQFYGLGICDIADGAQRALDATVRSRIDNKRISMNSTFAVNLDQLVRKKDKGMFPGQVYFTRGDPNSAIKNFVIPDITGGSYIEAQEFERAIHEATGIAPIVGGQVTSGSQTATEVTIQRRQASVRLRQVALGIEDNIIEPVLRQFYQISLQFFNEDEIIKTTGAGVNVIDNLKNITVADIVGDYNFIPLGVAGVVAQGNFNKIMDFLTRTANQFDIQVTDRAFLLRKAYEALGFNNAERVFRRDQPAGREMLERASGSKGVGSPPGSGGATILKGLEGQGASNQGSIQS